LTACAGLEADRCGMTAAAPAYRSQRSAPSSHLQRAHRSHQEQPRQRKENR
jgi:hypothetical protein